MSTTEKENATEKVKDGLTAKQWLLLIISFFLGLGTLIGFERLLN